MFGVFFVLFNRLKNELRPLAAVNEEVAKAAKGGLVRHVILKAREEPGYPSASAKQAALHPKVSSAPLFLPFKAPLCRSRAHGD